MSSLDVFDVLDIQPRGVSPNVSSQGSSMPPSKSIKPQITGMQRELYNLLGDNTPPIVVQPGTRFKDKLTSLHKPSPWTYVEFRTGSNVHLRHWVKGSKELVVHDELPLSSFEKFNQKLTLPEFNEEEYKNFMICSEDNKAEDKIEIKWNYAEVNYLFTLARRYDLRWHIIYDRYEYNKERNLEDLKEIFYKTCKQYFLSKDPDNPLIHSLDYQKEKELERKKYLQRLLSRSAAEIAEEEALIIESKKFEMTAKKTLQERESLLRLLDHPRSDKPIGQFLTSQGINQLYNNLLNDKTRKRKPDLIAPENPWMKQQQQFAKQKQQIQQNNSMVKKEMSETSSEKVEESDVAPKLNKRQKLEMQTAIKRKQESEYAEQLLQNFTNDERRSLGVIAHGEKLTPGVYLRSSKISTFKPSIQNKVSSILQELELTSRPVMPSLMVIQKYEELQKHIITLLDLKKQLDKLEADRAIVE